MYSLNGGVRRHQRNPQAAYTLVTHNLIHHLLNNATYQPIEAQQTGNDALEALHPRCSRRRHGCHRVDDAWRSTVKRIDETRRTVDGVPAPFPFRHRSTPTGNRTTVSNRRRARRHRR